MAIDFKTFHNVVDFITRVRKPVLLRGRHGIGKSCVVYQYAVSASLPVIERRASQMTEGDLVGLPELSEGVTTFCPPDWFKAACDRPVVLFLDEVDRAVPEVRQGIFELTDSRKLNGHVLHPDTLVFAAVNGGEHGAQYQVGEMDPAELDRWTVFDIEPTVEDWLAWGKDEVHGLVWDFINHNRNHLEHTGDFEPNKVYPSRRSWHRFSDCLVQSDLLNEPKKSLPELYTIGCAFIGFEAAIAFRDFAENHQSVISIEDILVHGKVEETSGFGINDHCAIVEKMEAENTFGPELPDDQIHNLARWFMVLPSEVAMKLWTVMGMGDIQNTVHLHQAQVDGVAVSSHIVELLTGGSDDSSES